LKDKEKKTARVVLKGYYYSYAVHPPKPKSATQGGVYFCHIDVGVDLPTKDEIWN
jgi:hypothetical protein